VLDDEIAFIHACCAYAKLVSEEFCRRLANDVLELTDEVWLIGQTTGLGYLRPRPAVPSFRKDPLKPRQARESLRTDAEGSTKGARKMT
jgi:hypothetical protein